VALRTQRPLVLARGDRFIIRSYSPVTTIGGGVVIEPDLLAACPRARTRARMGAHLGAVEAGRPEDHLARALATLGGRPAPIAELARAAGVPDPDVAAKSVAALAAGGVAIPLAGGGLWADRAGLGKLIDETRSYLDAYYRTHRYGPGAGREDMRSRVFGGLEARRYGALLEYLESAGVIRVRKDYVSAADEGSARAAAALRIWDLLEDRLRDAGVAPPEAAALSAATGLAAGDVEDALAALTARGCAIRLVGLPFHRDVVARAREVVAGHFAAGHAELSVAAFRDLIGATRKYALPLLEYCDRTGVTARRGETRVAGPARGAAEKGPEAMEEEPELE
jgi:selenocysteine-specific elongation factor